MNRPCPQWISVGLLAGLVLLHAGTAQGAIMVRMHIGFGVYPYGTAQVTNTTAGSGLLANNGSGRALMQLIYAGPDQLIGNGSNRVDLANAAHGYVAGDDAAWQSLVLEKDQNGVDEWGFSSALPDPYVDLAWLFSGFCFARVFQDDTPQPGEAFYDSPLIALDTALFHPYYGFMPQRLAIGSPSAGVALDQWLPETTNITRTTGPDQWDLMSVPLHISPTNQFGLVATNAAVGSVVYFYDPAISNFAEGMKSAKGWASAQSNRMVLPGESFFLRTPASAGHVISVSGAIPLSPVTNQVYARWSALGYPFPDPMAWTDTSLSSNLAVGTLVYFWNLGRQQFDIYRKGPPAKGGWGPASNHVIHPGDGFIVRQPPGSTPFLWIQERGP